MHSTSLTSRRALLGAFIGGAGAVVAQAIGRPVSALATDNTALMVAEQNTQSLTATTRLINIGTGPSGQPSGTVLAVKSESTAVRAETVQSKQAAVYGRSTSGSTGILGASDVSGNDLPGPGQTGVLGIYKGESGFGGASGSKVGAAGV